MQTITLKQPLPWGMMQGLTKGFYWSYPRKPKLGPLLIHSAQEVSKSDSDTPLRAWLAGVQMPPFATIYDELPTSQIVTIVNVTRVDGKFISFGQVLPLEIPIKPARFKAFSKRRRSRNAKRYHSPRPT